MKTVFFLCTVSDRDNAQELQDYLQGKLRKSAEVRNITGTLAEKRNVEWALRNSDCIVLVASPQASSLIKSKQQETKGRFVTFDGKFIHEEFKDNRQLVEKLIVVFLTERTENDWVPSGVNEKKIFNLQEERIRVGNPALTHLEYTVRRVLGETALDW